MNRFTRWLVGLFCFSVFARNVFAVFLLYRVVDVTRQRCEFCVFTKEFYGSQTQINCLFCPLTISFFTSELGNFFFFFVVWYVWIMKTFKMEKDEKGNEDEPQPKCNSEAEKNCTFKDEISPYERKYYALLRRCESISLSNECLVNRIYHVKKLIRRYRKERECLVRTVLFDHQDHRLTYLMVLLHQNHLVILHLLSQNWKSQNNSGIPIRDWFCVVELSEKFYLC